MTSRLTRLALCALATLWLVACHRQVPAGAAPTGATGTPPVAGQTAQAVAATAARIALSADNVRIAYQVSGQGEPAVILIHGWATDAGYWQGQLEALRPRYTVVTVDLAGHGASGANRTDWSIAHYAQDVAAVARQLPNQKLVLVGHAMGATVALAAAPLIGARVAGIVAVDALRSVGQPPLPAAEVQQRLAPFRADFVGATRTLVSDSLFRRDASSALVQKVAYNMSLEPPAVGVPTLAALLSLDLTPLLPAIHVPVYAINSDLMPTDAPRVRKSLPDFHLDVLDHTGHFLMLEAPARFNPLLLKDIDAIAGH